MDSGRGGGEPDDIFFCGSPIDITSYGAVLDGTTDNTAYFTAAMAATNKAYIPAGVCVLENASILSNGEVYGAGMGITTLKLKAGAATTRSPLTNADRVSGNTNISVHDLSIDGNHAAQTNDADGQEVHCLFFLKVDGFALYNLDCREAVNHCIMLQEAANGTLNNCHGHYSAWDSGIEVNGHAIAGGSHDIIANNCTANYNVESGFENDAGAEDVTWINCTAHDNGMNGVEMEHHYIGDVMTVETQRITVTGGEFYNNGNEGVLLLATHSTVTGTTCNDNGLNGIANRQGGQGTPFAGGDYATITDNACSNNTYAGVLIAPLNTNTVESGTTGSGNPSGLVVYDT